MREFKGLKRGKRKVERRERFMVKTRFQFAIKVFKK
jgi:hypothetical protein